MVKKTIKTYSYAAWRKENPVEADIFDLIDAANSYALSQVPHVESESDDPNESPVRVCDELTELELTIQRGEQAIRLMMGVSQARKAAGLSKRVRGKDKSYNPLNTSRSDPQVQVVLKMMRGQITQEMAFSQVSKIISPNEKIDQRTLKLYVDDLIKEWESYAMPDQNPFWVGEADK